MLAAIVRTSLANPRMVIASACLIAVLGAAALTAVRFDVFPDLAPPHVLVQTEAPGPDATQVEALITRRHRRGELCGVRSASILAGLHHEHSLAPARA